MFYTARICQIGMGKNTTALGLKFTERNSNLKIVKISMLAIPAIMCVLLLYQIQKNLAKIFEKYFITSFQK